MPLLEQPRRPFAHPGRFLSDLIGLLPGLARQSRTHWPAIWLACQMLGWAAGGHWGKTIEQLPTDLPRSAVKPLVRTTAVLPILLTGLRGPGALLVWAGVGLGNAVAGAVEASHRAGRRQAVVATPWQPATPLVQTGHAVARISGWPRPGKGNKWSAPGRLLAWEPRDSSATPVLVPVVGQGLTFSGRNNPPRPGEILVGPLEIRPPPAATVPGAFDYRKFLAGRGLTWQARWLDHRAAATNDPVAAIGSQFLAPARHRINQRLRRLLPAREAELAGAVLLGIRSPESRLISAPFNALGLAHLFAVSGLHVGILLGIILLPNRWLALSPRLSVLPLWGFVPLYLLLTGLPGSVVRAGGMGLLAAQARPLGRQVDGLRALGLLYWCGSILDPLQNLDTGLQLSYLAAGGILLVSRLTQGLHFSERRWLQPVCAGLAVSFAAQWFTLPVVAASFGRISLLSPLANLVAVPLFGVAVWAVVLSLVASLVWMPLGQALAAWGWLLFRSISGLVATVSNGTGGWTWGLAVPAAAQVAVWLGLTLVLVALLRHRLQAQRRWLTGLTTWLLLPALLLLSLGPFSRELPAAAGQVVVWQFDVGQGDCGLVVFPDGWTALIDTGGRFGHRAPPDNGPMGRTILPYLQRQGITKVDAVLLTHGHLDHTGGAQALAAALDVGQWYVSGHAARALPAHCDTTRIQVAQAGQVLHRWQGWTLTIHYPAAGQDHADSENNWSLVVGLNHDQETKMVWSGDLEFAGERALLDAIPSLNGAQVFKAGHHGSNTSGSQPLLDLLQPDLILISCGVGNSYGHPSHGVFLAAGDTIPILRTDRDGSIRLEWDTDRQLRWQTMSSRGEILRSP